MKPVVQIGLLSLLLPLVTGCPFGCDLMYRYPSLEITQNGKTFKPPGGASLGAPGTVTLRSDGLGNGCGDQNRPQASSVAFYVGGQRIGEDTSAPFEVTWTLEPGKKGVPSTGSASVEVYAVTNLAGLPESQRMTVEISAPQPATASR